MPTELDEIYKRGLALYEAGKFAEAIPLAEKFIAVAKASYGEQHPFYAEGIGGLGVLYQALDRPGEAESLLKQALSIKEMALGPDHTRVAAALYYLTEFYRKYNRLAEAEPLYTRALSTREKDWRTPEGDSARRQLLPNPWGLYNVHGNAWDWTEDCWNRTNAGNSGDGSPRPTGDCSLRVIRGAGWNNAPHTLRSARREREPLDVRASRMGFRVARTLSAP